MATKKIAYFNKRGILVIKSYGSRSNSSYLCGYGDTTESALKHLYNRLELLKYETLDKVYEITKRLDLLYETINADKLTQAEREQFFNGD